MKTPLVAPLIAVTPDEYETPMSTMLKACAELLDGDKTGQILEISGSNLYYQQPQAYPDEVARWLWEDAGAFWMDALSRMGAGS